MSVRKFKTGATRNPNTDKNDYEGFLCPLVIEEFGNYMHHHRKQEDGTLRPGDNWKKGIPKDEYMKSAWRHFLDWWKEHHGHDSREGLKYALCGLMFNVMGYLHEILEAEENIPCEEDNGPDKVEYVPTPKRRA